jgi:hypothetical protein
VDGCGTPDKAQQDWAIRDNVALSFDTAGPVNTVTIRFE